MLIFLIFLVWDHGKAANTMSILCLPSIFNYIWITDRHRHQRQETKERLSVHYFLKFLSWDSCASINRISIESGTRGETFMKQFYSVNFRFRGGKKLSFKNMKTENPVCCAWCFMEIFLLLMFWILMNTKNRILITCTLLVRYEKKGEWCNNKMSLEKRKSTKQRI